MGENKKLNDRLKGFLLGILTALIVFCVAFLIRNRDYIVHRDMTPTQAGARKKISDIYHTIDGAYLGKIDDEKLTEYMCAGLVQGLGDKYSTYYTQEQYEKIMEIFRLSLLLKTRLPTGQGLSREIFCSK
jgi:hypothetical protein